MWAGEAVREEERQRQAMIERQQREGYTYEWVHTQVQHVNDSPAPSNRRSDMLLFVLEVILLVKVLLHYVCLLSNMSVCDECKTRCEALMTDTICDHPCISRQPSSIGIS